MNFRFAWEPIRDVSEDMDALIGASGPRRSARLKRLKGMRLEASLSAQRLCRRLWAEMAGCQEPQFRIETDVNGRPFAPEAPFYLSLGHSDGFAAAAAADVPVGVDLQVIRPISDRVLIRCCSDEERAWLAEAPERERMERAIRLWTMKEAYGKMLGVGIFNAPRFTASFDGMRLKADYADARFLFPEAPDGFLFTVCLAPEG